jgi:hypothetical protein
MKFIHKYFFLSGILIVAFFLTTFEVKAQKISEKKIVYITRKGNKYHRDTCRYLSKSKIAISIEEAKKYYKPCKVCKPDLK